VAENNDYRQDAAKRQTAGFKFTHRPKASIVAPQGRLVAPIHVKFGRTKGHVDPLGHTKFRANQFTGVGTWPPKYQTLPPFGKQSPRRGEPLDRFLNFFTEFYTLTYPTPAFQIWLDSLHRLWCYCWKTERRSFRPNFSVHPYALEQKMIGTFFNGLDELYHHANFGADHTTCAGCRCENVVLVTFFSVCRDPRSERCSLEGGIFRRSIVVVCGLWVDFDAVFTIFQKGSAFQTQYMNLIFVAIFVFKSMHNWRRFLKLIRNWPKNAVLNLRSVVAPSDATEKNRNIGAQLQFNLYTTAQTRFWKIYFWCAQTCSFRAVFRQLLRTLTLAVSAG